MTIHSSKGLEFPYVVVLDRLTRPPLDRSIFLYEYEDSLNIKNILYRVKNRENFDEHYRDVIELQRELLEKDKLNLLYVALTRGMDGLIVVKNEKESIFDILDMQEDIVDGKIKLKRYLKRIKR